MSVKRLDSTVIAKLFVGAIVLVLSLTAGAQTYKVLYNFTGGADGGGVWGGVVMDKLGNLYGTTAGGGAYGHGTVFELSPNLDGTWTETVLHSFMLNDPDGFDPMSTPVLDASGNLYGTAVSGGPNNAGTAFELAPGSGGWTFGVLYGFCAQSNCSDGAVPEWGLIIDGQGNLYGASGGGTIGSGAVMELSPGATGWTEKVLYSFGTNTADGYAPANVLVFDAAGDLYGTTIYGGDLSCGGGNGCGVVYRLGHTSGGWKESVLHRFGSFPSDGISSGKGTLALDSRGNVFGTTLDGGGSGCASGVGCGTVFRMTRGLGVQKENIIHNFGNGRGGFTPAGGLVLDSAGNAYGTTDYSWPGCQCGTVYKLTPNSNRPWQHTILHTFNGFDGDLPVSNLIMDSGGNLYGTTVLGGSGGEGVVFEITP